MQERNMQMMQEEMNRRRSMMENMQMMQMQMREKFLAGVNSLTGRGSGLAGIGGDGGMAARIPDILAAPLRVQKQFGMAENFIMMPGTG